MTPVWWRRRRHLRRLLQSCEESDHAERVSEARRAIYEGECTLAEAGRIGDQVAEISGKLKVIGRRNHFSEQVADMLHGQGGGSTPVPRRG